MRTGNGSGTTGLQWLLGDHLGSTSVVTDANGTLITRTLYKPWGEVRSQTGTLPTDYTFTGQYSHAADFGLLFYNARWYDSSLGRFTSPDTLVPDPGNVLDWDRYSYVRNNPVKYFDPTGHYTETNDPCLTGCPIIDMSGWSGWAKAVATIALTVTVDNVTGGRTGTYGDSQWGVIPTREYINSGAWTVPPVFGGVVGATDDLIRSGGNLVDDASKGLLKQPFRSFTRSNFRENLKRLTGKGLNDIGGMDAHHVLPQQFEKQFMDAGINIHDPVFGSWVDASTHRGWSYAYNQRWSEFLDTKRTREEILNFARDLAKEYKFDVHFGSH
jgi:RHS repeat-associated protein